jgi:hypothetical protein
LVHDSSAEITLADIGGSCPLFILNPLDGRLKTGPGDTLLTKTAVETFLRGQKTFDGPALIGFCPAGDVHRVCRLQHLDGETPRDGFWARARVTIY